MQKIKAELEAAVAVLRDRVVLGVDVPAVQHRALIGRGGQHLNELQKKYSVMVQFPGSRSYSQGGEPENVEALAEADPANIVRVSGPRAAVEKAIDELKVGHRYLGWGCWIWRTDSRLGTVARQGAGSGSGHDRRLGSGEVSPRSNPTREYIQNTEVIRCSRRAFQCACKSCGPNTAPWCRFGSDR